MNNQKSRDIFVSKINKEYGERSIFKMNERPHITDIKVLPSGSVALDVAIGVGGFPRGRIVEIYGPEAAGKSMLSLAVIAQTQKLGGYAAFIDCEHALSLPFAQLLGVNTQSLYYSQPDDGEQALSIMEKIIESSLFDIVVLDSVAALVTEAELDDTYTDNKVAPTAILMAKALKRMTASISKTKTVAVFVNQLRERPMVMFGSPEYTPGGRALKFYASLRIDIRVKQKESKGDRQVAHTVSCNIVKNKVAPPFSKCMIRLDYKRGIDEKFDIIETAKELELIKPSGSWFIYNNLKFLGNTELYNLQSDTLDAIHKAITDHICLIRDGTNAETPSEIK